MYKNIAHIFNDGYIETIYLKVLLWYSWCDKVKRISMDIKNTYIITLTSGLNII